MEKEISYGIIPVKKYQNQWQFFLVHHKNGNHWGFPKGHANDNEKPLKAAEREFFEETQLHILKILRKEFYNEFYHFWKNEIEIDKEVKYFLALIEDKPFSVQKEEIIEGRWLYYNEAIDIITFENSRQICKKAYDYLQKEENL